MAKLQAEVVSLRGHKVHCEQASLSLQRELLQVHGHMQQQSSELQQLWQEIKRVAHVPEKEVQVVSSLPHRPVFLSWGLEPLPSGP